MKKKKYGMKRKHTTHTRQAMKCAVQNEEKYETNKPNKKQKNLENRAKPKRT